MKRNARGLVGGAVLLSVLSSPLHPPVATIGSTGQPHLVRARTVRTDDEPPPPTEQGGRWQPKVFEEHAQQDAIGEMRDLFFEVCGGSLDPPDENPAALLNLSHLSKQIATLCEKQDFIIALVPDPRHTRQALGFDRLVEAIQEAAQDQAFRFVKAFLPWDSKAHPESADPSARLEADTYAKARETFPGVLAFRNDTSEKPSSPPYLFVLLVAESPTGGIFKQQFLQAVQLISAVASFSPPTAGDLPGQARRRRHGRSYVKETKRREGRGGPSNDAATLRHEALVNLRILGPNFSGSLSSLAQLLQTAATSSSPPSTSTNPNVRYGSSLIFSGSISDRRAVQKFLATSNPADRPRTFVSCFPS